MRLDDLCDGDLLLRARGFALCDAFPKESIGTQSEKNLHKTLKYLIEPDSNNHEKEFLGSVCDILNDEGIIEIQTRSFDKLVPKLEKFLPVSQVTVVYPIVERKSILYIDVESGESIPPKRSPKKGSLTSALPEISKIKNFIPHDNLRILLVFLDATETRMLNGKKKVGRHKTAKIDLMPTAINSIIEFRDAEDFAVLLPQKLNDEFSSLDFEKVSHLHAIELHNSLMLLLHLGLVTREKRGGRSYVYSVKRTQ
ncbi:MAG: hypothetical protein IJX97_05490 [Clostridia bacterium]|nr:hypothetical protein [Clostridia bacterium]